MLGPVLAGPVIANAVRYRALHSLTAVILLPGAVLVQPTCNVPRATAPAPMSGGG